MVSNNTIQHLVTKQYDYCIQLNIEQKEREKVLIEKIRNLSKDLG